MGHNPNYSEDTGYVNIHGQDVRVYVCDKTGRILVPIDELKGMGFRIYRKSQYSRLLIDDSQFSKEFDMYMLQSAQTYMLQNKVAFKEHDILESINKCKAMLTGGQNDIQSPPNDLIQNESTFMRSYVTETSPTDISVTTTLRAPSSSTMNSLQNDRMFKGFTQIKSPSSVVEGKPSSSKENSETRNSFDSKPKGGFEQRKMIGRTSFDSNKSFETRKSMSPGGSNDNIAGKGGRGNNEQRRQTNFNQNTSNGFDGEKRDSESADEALDKLATVELNKPEHNVLVSHVERQNCIWVQDMENADVLLDIHKKIDEEAAKQKTSVKYTWNKIYLAQDDDAWYRCKIIKFKPLTVAFIDYGNTATVSELQEVSEELAKIPCQAVRLTFNESQTQYKPQAYDNITVKIKRKFERGTYAVEVVTKKPEPTPKVEPPPSKVKPLPSKVEPPSTPNPKTYFMKPQVVNKLENGQRVMIIGHNGAKLAVRTKECFEKLRQIETILAEVDPISVDRVEKGQLVLYDKDNKLQRALVLNVEEKSVEIELLDQCDKMKVSSAPLKYINESLAEEPPTYIMTPPIKGYTDGADEIIQELINKKSKPIVVISGSTFDLKLGEELLSEKWNPPEEHSDRPLLKNFEFFKPNLGTGVYILNVYRNIDEVYFASADALEEHLVNIIKSDLDDDDPYEPVVGEICFGFYQEAWWRCLVLSQVNGIFEVQFIDYGNLEFLKSDQLRQLTDDAKSTPILAMRCQLTGLPPVKNVEKLVKETVVEGDNYRINIKSFNGEVYEVEMPSVYKEVRVKP